MSNKLRTHLLFACFLLAGSIAWLSSCRNNNPTSVSRQNLSTYYRPEEKLIRPQYVLYNITDSMTRLYFTVTSTDLLYTKANGENNYNARILVSYTVHPVDAPKLMIDSGHVVMNDAALPGEKKQLAAAVDMDVYDKGRFVVEIAFRDLNKMTVSYALLHLDHRGANARNNFVLTQPGSETPLFKNHVDSGEAFNVRYNDRSITRLRVTYYANRTGPAIPPYAIDRAAPMPQPDSAWWIDVSENPALRFPGEGFYRFSTDTAATGGLTVSRFHSGYPEITLAQQLLYPLRYLVTKQEYARMDTAANIKKAVDNFWLNATGSQERARELIRNYYNRVGAANVLFSSEKEGWKTDRGVIYIVFGPPQSVYRNGRSETWVYSNDLGAGGLNFIFDHVPNALSDEEYVLSRNVNYKVNWIQAVDAWRQGHVYTLH